MRRLLTRMSNPEEDQSISGWTGFNILIRNDKLVVQDTVGYLPAINLPATTISRVSEVLTQTLNIMETLGLNESVCVFAQVFYVKTADIIYVGHAHLQGRTRRERTLEASGRQKWTRIRTSGVPDGHPRHDSRGGGKQRYQEGTRARRRT